MLETVISPKGILVYGVGDANQLAGGISQALITTAAGLTVAIPSFFFYRYFKGRVTALGPSLNFNTQIRKIADRRKVSRKILRPSESRLPVPR